MLNFLNQPAQPPVQNIIPMSQIIMSLGEGVFIQYTGPITQQVIYDLEKSLKRIAKIHVCRGAEKLQDDKLQGNDIEMEYGQYG